MYVNKCIDRFDAFIKRTNIISHTLRINYKNISIVSLTLYALYSILNINIYTRVGVFKS